MKLRLLRLFFPIFIYFLQFLSLYSLIFVSFSTSCLFPIPLPYFFRSLLPLLIHFFLLFLSFAIFFGFTHLHHMLDAILFRWEFLASRNVHLEHSTCYSSATTVVPARKRKQCERGESWITEAEDSQLLCYVTLRKNLQTFAHSSVVPVTG
jgi:hypothetical protein